MNISKNIIAPFISGFFLVFVHHYVSDNDVVSSILQVIIVATVIIVQDQNRGIKIISSLKKGIIKIQLLDFILTISFYVLGAILTQLFFYVPIKNIILISILFVPFIVYNQLRSNLTRQKSSNTNR
jgi:hypothetical protein